MLVCVGKLSDVLSGRTDVDEERQMAISLAEDRQDQIRYVSAVHQIRTYYQSEKNDIMNIVQLLSRDVTDKQQRHFVLISIKVPKKSQDVKTPPQKKTNQYADSTEPAKTPNKLRM